MPDVGKTLETMSSLRRNKASIDTTLQEIKRFILPNQANITSQSSPGDRSDDRSHRFDDTAPEALVRAASGIQGGMTPSNSLWNRLEFEDEQLENDKPSRDWLDECSRRQHKRIKASGFGTAINEDNQQLLGFGTSCLMIEEGPKNLDGTFSGFRFNAWGIGEYLFTEGEDGHPNGAYRTLRLTAAQALEKFKELPRFAGLGPSIDKALEDPKKAGDTFEIVHAIYPRTEYNPRGGALALPYASCYIAVKDKHLIHEGGFHEMPAAIARWDRNSQDMGWGRGPGWTILPTVKSLNTAEKGVLKAFAKDLAPPLTVPNKSVAGGIRANPNAVIYYDARKAGGQKPEYLNSGTRWDANQLEREEKRNSVRRAFFNHLLELPGEGPEMTLGEAERRYQLLVRDQVGAFERMTSEKYSPIVLRTFGIMFRAGAFAPPPPLVVEHIRRTGGLGVSVVFTGPLARALQREEVAAIEQTYSAAAMISQAKGGDLAPFDLLDDDAALEIVHKQTGAASAILRSRDDAQKIREQRAARQAQQVEADRLEQLARAGQAASASAAR